MKYIATIIGHYSDSLDGQTIKTKIITDELIKKYGKETINTFNTVGGIKALIKVFFAIPSLLRNSKNVCMLPAHNAIRILTPLLSFWNHRYKRKLHYCVIGGWLPDFIKNRKRLTSELRSFNYIYVETATMKSLLEEQDFDNIVVMPNCKKLRILKPEELIFQESEPYKLCTFSRVMKEKGIEDAVDAVRLINAKYGKTIFSLDIYGMVDPPQTEWFEDMKKNFPDYISYGGMVPYEKSVEILKRYFALLFPTYYNGEGFAGTIIDAYAAGVPVLASDWKYNSEIISNGYTGLIFQANDVSSIGKCLKWCHDNQAEMMRMKTNCIKEAIKYLPENVISILTDNMQ